MQSGMKMNLLMEHALLGHHDEETTQTTAKAFRWTLPKESPSHAKLAPAQRQSKKIKNKQQGKHAHEACVPRFSKDQGITTDAKEYEYVPSPNKNNNQTLLEECDHNVEWWDIYFDKFFPSL